MVYEHKTRLVLRRAERQGGAVLLLTLLFVAMFSGLGILAMRHTQAELRSAGTYVDSAQAELLAVAGIAMIATDIKTNWSKKDLNWSAEWSTYKDQFTAMEYEALSGDDDDDTDNTHEPRVELKFSPMFGGGAHDAGVLPDEQLTGVMQLGATSVLANAFVTTEMKHEMPILAPSEAGFSSSSDDNVTYSWYYFTTTNKAYFGSPETHKRSQGQAVARSRMVIGPLLAL
jgi:hypothetical protein